MSIRSFLCLFMIVGLSGQLGWAQETKAEKKDPPKPAVKAPPKNVVPPTQADVPYGKHERQVIDFYQAKSDTPTPLVFYIHARPDADGDAQQHRCGRSHDLQRRPNSEVRERHGLLDRTAEEVARQSRKVDESLRDSKIPVTE